MLGTQRIAKRNCNKCSFRHRDREHKRELEKKNELEKRRYKELNKFEKSHISQLQWSESTNSLHF